MVTHPDPGSDKPGCGDAKHLTGEASLFTGEEEEESPPDHVVSTLSS